MAWQVGKWWIDKTWKIDKFYQRLENNLKNNSNNDKKMKSYKTIDGCLDFMAYQPL